MKNKAFNVLIGLALLLGVASIFLIKKLVEVERNKVKSSQMATVKVETDKILVTTNDIAPGKPFDVLNYKVVDMPKNLVPDSAVKDAAQLDGKLAAFLIPKGDMILSSKAVIPSQLPRVSQMIEKGRRLISIQVNEIVTSGYIIKNGDYVDLVGSFDVRKDMLGPRQEIFGTSAAVTFMQRVKVVDIFKGEVESSSESSGTKDKPVKPASSPTTTGQGVGGQGKRLGEGTIATFDVSPKEAEFIMNAVKSAKGVSLVLRRFDDQNVPTVNPLHQKIIAGLSQADTGTEDAAPVAPPPTPPPRRKVL
jgi:Flp pilus assembly protein CpaB